MPPQEDKQFAASDRSVEEQAVSSVWLEELLQYLSTDERAILHKLYFQDILKGRDVHFLTGQAVHAVRDGDIAYIVFGEKDLDIASSFNIVPTEPR